MATKTNAASIAVNEIIEPARDWDVNQSSDRHLIAELWHHWFPVTHHTVALSRNKAVCHPVKSIAAHRSSLLAPKWLGFFPPCFTWSSITNPCDAFNISIKWSSGVHFLQACVWYPGGKTCFFCTCDVCLHVIVPVCVLVCLRLRQLTEFWTHVKFLHVLWGCRPRACSQYELKAQQACLSLDSIPIVLSFLPAMFQRKALKRRREEGAGAEEREEAGGWGGGRKDEQPFMPDFCPLLLQ